MVATHSSTSSQVSRLLGHFPYTCLSHKPASCSLCLCEHKRFLIDLLPATGVFMIGIGALAGAHAGRRSRWHEEAPQQVKRRSPP